MSKYIEIGLIKNNPFRNLEINPIREDDVKTLMDSIDRNKFWKGIVARPDPDGEHYQIAFGHHRIEAARRLGIEKVHLDITKLDDMQMIQHLADENANQKKGKDTRGIMEVVFGAIPLLEQARADANSDQKKFLEISRIAIPVSDDSHKIWPENIWSAINNQKEIGRDILKKFVSKGKHNENTYSDEELALGINLYYAESRKIQAEEEKRKAEEKFKKMKANEKSYTRNEKTKITEKKDEAEKKFKNADSQTGYKDAASYFTYPSNAAIFFRVLKKRYPQMSKEDQIKYAKEINAAEIPGKKIEDTLLRWIEGKSYWHKKEMEKIKKQNEWRKKQKEKRKLEEHEWKQKMPIEHFIRDLLGPLNQLDGGLENLIGNLEYVQDEQLLNSFVHSLSHLKNKCRVLEIEMDSIKKEEIIYEA